MKTFVEDVLKGQGDNYIFPFFWQHGESEDVLREYMKVIHESNIGAVCVEARPHPDFAGPRWWHDMDIILDFISSDQIGELKRRAVIILVFWIIMVIAVFIDLWTGVEKARARHEQIYSDKLRRTVAKIGEYWRVQIMFLLFDIVGSFITVYNLPYASMFGTLCIVYIELRSVFENLKEKRSVAADIPEAMKEIINCKDIEKAKELIEKLKGVGNEKK